MVHTFLSIEICSKFCMETDLSLKANNGSDFQPCFPAPSELMHASGEDDVKGARVKPIGAFKLQQYETIGILNKWLKSIPVG